MKNDKQPNDNKPSEKKRRPYTPPMVESEDTFERAAVLSCGKAPGVCLVNVKTS